MSSDNPYFDEKVNGRVRAELVLDENGSPEFHIGRSLKHYKVTLFLETENAEVQRVIYKLDPTYNNPVRESSDASTRFQVVLTTYGDYRVTIDVQVGDEIVREVIPLSKLLSETHEESSNVGIQAALEEIKTH